MELLRSTRPQCANIHIQKIKIYGDLNYLAAIVFLLRGLFFFQLFHQKILNRCLLQSFSMAQIYLTHGFRHLALWEILITMNGMMKTQGQKQIGSLRGPNPGARSGAIRAPRAPSCSTGGAIAFQCFKLDLFIFFQFSSSDIKLFYYTYTFYGLSFHKTEMELLILLH